MLIFATSDKGGTGRSVTSSNVAYRHALKGGDCCYLDFDFGSPTSGAIFDLPGALAGVPEGGLHSYMVDGVATPRRPAPIPTIRACTTSPIPTRTRRSVIESTGTAAVRIRR